MSELRLEAEQPAGPLRRRRDGGEHDQQDNDDLTQSILVADMAASWMVRALPQRKTLRIRPSMPGPVPIVLWRRITVHLRCIDKAVQPVPVFRQYPAGASSESASWPAFFSTRSFSLRSAKFLILTV
jgi:hypothetical protein